ncbi:hypothetical protein BDV11DRAFT_94129 [Aspergillus similis]
MFCPCAGSYFTVEGLQTETPRLVRSKDDRVPTPRSRAPLPVQIRPRSARQEFQKENGQTQANMYGPVSSSSRQGLYVNLRSIYGLRGYHQPLGIIKLSRDEFPFDHEISRGPRTVQRFRKGEKLHVRDEVGSPSPIRSHREPLTSDFVKVRAYRRGQNMNPCQQEDILAEKVRFRRGDIVVCEARADAFSINRINQVRKLKSTAQNWNSPTQAWDTPTQGRNILNQDGNSLDQVNSSPSQHWSPVGNSQW